MHAPSLGQGLSALDNLEYQVSGCCGCDVSNSPFSNSWKGADGRSPSTGSARDERENNNNANIMIGKS